MLDRLMNQASKVYNHPLNMRVNLMGTKPSFFWKVMNACDTYLSFHQNEYVVSNYKEGSWEFNPPVKRDSTSIKLCKLASYFVFLAALGFKSNYQKAAWMLLGILVGAKMLNRFHLGHIQLPAMFRKETEEEHDARICQEIISLYETFFGENPQADQLEINQDKLKEIREMQDGQPTIPDANSARQALQRVMKKCSHLIPENAQRNAEFVENLLDTRLTYGFSVLFDYQTGKLQGSAPYDYNDVNELRYVICRIDQEKNSKRQERMFALLVRNFQDASCTTDQKKDISKLFNETTYPNHTLIGHIMQQLIAGQALLQLINDLFTIDTYLLNSDLLTNTNLEKHFFSSEQHEALTDKFINTTDCQFKVKDKMSGALIGEGYHNCTDYFVTPAHVLYILMQEGLVVKKQ